MRPQLKPLDRPLALGDRVYRTLRDQLEAARAALLASEGAAAKRARRAAARR
jgi:hypothetical protein